MSGLISACESGNHPERGLKIFEGAKVINALAERALKVFQVMVQQAVVPSASNYKALASACEKGK